MDFRGLLRARRFELGMTQLDLACVIEVTSAAISQWGRVGTHPPYKASSKALGMSERDLFYPFYPHEESVEKEGSKMFIKKNDALAHQTRTDK